MHVEIRSADGRAIDIFELITVLGDNPVVQENTQKPIFHIEAGGSHPFSNQLYDNEEEVRRRLSNGKYVVTDV